MRLEIAVLSFVLIYPLTRLVAIVSVNVLSSSGCMKRMHLRVYQV